jgi:acyl dehydratase
MGSSRAEPSVTSRAFAGGEHPWSWLVPLTPHFAGPGVDVPDDAVQVSTDLWWSTPRPPAARLTVSRSEVWRATRDGRVEVALDVRCEDEAERTVAWARWVCRGTAADRLDHGVRAPSRPPAAPIRGEVVGCARVDRRTVLAFARATGADHPLHTDVAACAAAGFDDVVVQGVLFVDAVAQAAALGAGRVRMWFLRPVTAGSRCLLHRDETHWHVAGDAGVVAVATVDHHAAAPSG